MITAKDARANSARYKEKQTFERELSKKLQFIDDCITHASLMEGKDNVVMYENYDLLRGAMIDSLERIKK